jgi:hypothetical protein
LMERKEVGRKGRSLIGREVMGRDEKGMKA